MSDLLAGAGVCDISPTQPLALHGYPHAERLSTGVHDPLLASVLVLRCGADAVVLVALDLLFVTPLTARTIRRRAAAAAGVDEARVFISCTHTHSGPVTAEILAWADDPTIPAPDPAYLAQVEDGVLQAVAAAGAAMQPAEVAWTAADGAGVGGNRLAPDGVTDTEVGILAVRRAADHRWLAAAVIYGMHPTVLHEDSTLVSADFPFYTRTAIREALGAEPVILYHTAPAGNQSPRHVVNGQTFAEAERLGRMLGERVGRALLALGDGAFGGEDVPLSGALAEVDLQPRQLLDLSAAEEQLRVYRRHYENLKAAGAPRAEVRTAECAIFGAEGALNLARAQAAGIVEATLADDRPFEVQALRIGPTCLGGLPGELFAEYALAVKARAARRCFVVSLVNGELLGYIVTPAAAAAGGYEATNSLFPPAAGARLVEALVRVIAGLD